jgi:hypothetical protein
MIIPDASRCNHARCLEELLIEKVKQGVSIIIVSLPYDIEQNTLLHEYISNILDDHSLINYFITQNKLAKETFFRVKKFAEDTNANASVKIYECVGPPSCGLMIRDHRLESYRMRMTIYSRLTSERIHPLLDTDPSTSEGLLAYDIYYDYFNRLLLRSREVHRLAES